ncbi:MAG: hypothetical protein WBW67_20570, partial [Pseudolabrys sp.]
EVERHTVARRNSHETLRVFSLTVFLAVLLSWRLQTPDHRASPQAGTGRMPDFRVPFGVKDASSASSFASADSLICSRAMFRAGSAKYWAQAKAIRDELQIRTVLLGVLWPLRQKMHISAIDIYPAIIRKRHRNLLVENQ